MTRNKLARKNLGEQVSMGPVEASPTKEIVLDYRRNRKLSINQLL